MDLKSSLWYQCIRYYKQERIITNGLTIPYLIGLYEEFNYSNGEKEKEINGLINLILNSDIEQYCAIIQRCPGILQYVIGIDYREYCNIQFKKNIQFKNLKENTSIIITLNAEKLGNDINMVIDKFNELYLDLIIQKRYSWDKDLTKWTEFSPEDKIDISKFKEYILNQK